MGGTPILRLLARGPRARTSPARPRASSTARRTTSSTQMADDGFVRRCACRRPGRGLRRGRPDRRRRGRRRGGQARRSWPVSPSACGWIAAMSRPAATAGSAGDHRRHRGRTSRGARVETGLAIRLIAEALAAKPTLTTRRGGCLARRPCPVRPSSADGGVRTASRSRRRGWVVSRSRARVRAARRPRRRSWRTCSPVRRGGRQHVGRPAAQAGSGREPRLPKARGFFLGRPASATRSMTDDARRGARPRLVDRYRRFLPITDATPALTLGEGFTPLVSPAPRLGAHRRPEPAPQARGPEPDRLVQGPGHGRRRVEGDRGGRDVDHLRLDRQHVGVAPRRTVLPPGSRSSSSCRRARSRSASSSRR